MKRVCGHRSTAVYLAEALGTFVFVLASAGVVCIDQSSHGSIGQVGVALANGFVLAAMMYALSATDCAYLNPAATLAAVILARTTLTDGVRHVVAQLSGAALAGIALRLLFPGALSTIHLGTPSLTQGMTLGRGVAAEALLSFAWVLTLAGTLWRKPAPATGPLAVGLVYAAGVLFVGQLTGGAGNPARAFGPAFASGSYAGHFVYWLGPVLGGGLAAGVYLLLWRERANKPGQARRVGDGQDAMSMYRMAVALYREGRLEEAAHRFASAAELRPDWPEPYYYIGMVYRDFGDEINANAFFDAALHYRYELLSRARAERAWR